MKFHETAVHGAFLVEPEPGSDIRGFFARIACAREFERNGLEPSFVQVNVTWNERAGTIRGLHLQRPPHAEGKLVRCIRGSIFDVAYDARENSPTHGRHATASLSAANRLMLYLPPGCAHGYQTLDDDTEVLTFHSAFYAPGFEQGFRWNDPQLGIQWPIADPVLSDKDRGQPLLPPSA